MAPNTQNMTFAEFENNEPGIFPVDRPRTNISEQLDAPVRIENILGTAYTHEW